MALRNRDGTAFRLRGPIPFMRDQQMWNDFVLHNFVFKGITVSDNGPVEFVHQGKLGFIEELADIAKEENNNSVPEFKNDTKVVETPPTTITSVLKNSPNKVTAYCLPGIIKKVRDDFYGEIRGEKQSYGDPFVFEGIILYGDDLSLSVWSPTDKVTKGSVLFPQNRDKRWWKVVSIEPNMQGWMLSAVISDFQPQFHV